MVPLSVVDAFTDTPFAGNPAAVCLLGHWPADAWLGLVGREMNLSETAFLVPQGTSGSDWELRWFTPRVEVALCGHATLASAHFLWDSGTTSHTQLRFHTRQSGTLSARRRPSNEIELDFPARPAIPCAAPPGLIEALGAKALAVGYDGEDYLVEVATDVEVQELAPDFARLARTECRGVTVTARSTDPRYDFVSRFFGPAVGINEDPVTGSAHCCLAEWWGDRLGKAEMTGFQASERGGTVRMARSNGRVKLIGRAVTITTGHLTAGVGLYDAK